jgi:2-polyprenyl-6-methoxyphenol hydroxylase-like FAD-dependent oxidoreductase
VNQAPTSTAAQTDVLIVGAGPTGLTLATALAAQGVATVVVDRQAEGANTSRAAVVHARTLEVLEPLGVADRLVARSGCRPAASRSATVTGFWCPSSSTACRRATPTH